MGLGLLARSSRASAEFLSHKNLPGCDVTSEQAETLVHIWPLGCVERQEGPGCEWAGRRVPWEDAAHLKLCTGTLPLSCLSPPRPPPLSLSSIQQSWLLMHRQTLLEAENCTGCVRGLEVSSVLQM